jgi:hypothetical protein
MIEFIANNDIFTRGQFESMTIEQIDAFINIAIELLKLKF